MSKTQAIQKLLHKSGLCIRKYSPVALSCVASVGVVVTAIAAAKATPRAVALVYANSRKNHDGDPYAYTKKEAFKTTYWTYQEAALTPQEFNEYTNLLMAENAIKGTNDSDNIVQIMAGQETGDSQQLAIMEAIADLYDAVAAMIPE